MTITHIGPGGGERESIIQEKVLFFLRHEAWGVTACGRVNSGMGRGSVRFNWWYAIGLALKGEVTAKEYQQFNEDQAIKTGGFPDLWAMVEGIGVVFIECKREGGTLSRDQALFIQQAERAGVMVLVPESLGEFREMWGKLIVDS